MNNIVIKGIGLTSEAIFEALRRQFPDKEIIVDNGDSDGGDGKTEDSPGGKSGDEKEDATNSIFILENAYSDLNKMLASKTKEIKTMEKTTNKAVASINTFHHQQKQLFDEFVLLRTRYDDQRTSLLDALWQKCCKFHPELGRVPDQEDEATFLENEDQVGCYNLGGILGAGQFATVKSCQVSHSRAAGEKNVVLDRDYAMKIINKDKILSFGSLKRVNNEILILDKLRNQYIVSISDVIQTKYRLYIVTEKGGEDLFEFFDEHPDGVPEDWARNIIKCVLKGVLFCHLNKVCHRDLKPENILVNFDANSGSVSSLKLCDFGLAAPFDRHVSTAAAPHGNSEGFSSKNDPKAPPRRVGSKDEDEEPYFTDFCGSPGFFAPEMIIRGAYYGDKADVWSCGCILLELVLGHERFCDTWMVAYDYEVLQDKQEFTERITTTLEELKGILDFSEELNEFILLFLSLRMSQRPSIFTLMQHPWVKLSDQESSEIKEWVESVSSVSRSNEEVRRLSISVEDDAIAADEDREASDSKDTFAGDYAVDDNSSTSSTLMSPIARLERSESIHHNVGHNHEGTAVDPRIIKAAYSTFSERERKAYEVHNYDAETNSERHRLNLPPIEPQTPNVGNVRKILQRGAELAQKVTKNSPHVSNPTSPSTPMGKGQNGSSALFQSNSVGRLGSNRKEMQDDSTHSSPVRFNIDVDSESENGSPIVMAPPITSPGAAMGKHIPHILGALDEEVDEVK